MLPIVHYPIRILTCPHDFPLNHLYCISHFSMSPLPRFFWLRFLLQRMPIRKPWSLLNISAFTEETELRTIKSLPNVASGKCSPRETPSILSKLSQLHIIAKMRRAWYYWTLCARCLVLKSCKTLQFVQAWLRTPANEGKVLFCWMATANRAVTVSNRAAAQQSRWCYWIKIELIRCRVSGDLWWLGRVCRDHHHHQTGIVENGLRVYGTGGLLSDRQVTAAWNGGAMVAQKSEKFSWDLGAS